MPLFVVIVVVIVAVFFTVVVVKCQCTNTVSIQLLKDYTVHVYILTRSLISSLCIEWTPAMKGVGVLRTSNNEDGKTGIYT